MKTEDVKLAMQQDLKQFRETMGHGFDKLHLRLELFEARIVGRFAVMLIAFIGIVALLKLL